MPTHATNGSSGAPAATAAPAARSEASEQATSSVLALDGWGRLKPEQHGNGAAPTAAEPQPAPQLEPEPEPKTEPPLEAESDLEPPPPPLSAAASRRRAVNAGEQPLARLIEEAQRRQWVGEQPGPGLRLFGSALVFGLAVGAVVGAALRWLELRSAPPAPPPPPDDLAERLHRAWLAFSMVEGQGEGQTPRSRRPS